MTSSKVEREIMLDRGQFDGAGKLSKYKDGVKDKNIKGFSMKLKPGRPNLKQVSLSET